MCGRFYTPVDREEMESIIAEVNRKIKQRELDVSVKTGEIRPTDHTAVFVNEDGASPTVMKWGFPGFHKPGSTAKPAPLINARSETFRSLRSFAPYAGQRCLIPAGRYYEFLKTKDQDGRKPKIAFWPKDNPSELFWMAGIYRELHDSKVPVFTVLTMDASEQIRKIHDRMPVILGSKDARRAWMNGEENITELFGDATVRDIEFEPCGNWQMRLL